MGNLLDLGEFDEGSLLHVIRARFYDRNIYTNIGSPILIAVNPYQKLPELFNTKVARKYRVESLNIAKGMKPKQQDPHVFMIAEDAYQQMMVEKKN